MPLVAYQFGDFKLDLESWKLIKTSGEEIELSRQPFNLLKLLIKNKNKPVSKEQIINEVWGEGKSIGDGSINQLVATLRNVLDDEEKKIIKTKTGFGYSFGLEFKEVYEENPETSENKSIPESPTGESKIPAAEAHHSFNQTETLLPQLKRAEAETGFDNVAAAVAIAEETPQHEELSDKPPTFEAWAGKSGIIWLFAVITAVTVGFSIFYQDSTQATFFGSISHLFLVLVSLGYYHLFLHLKDFRSVTDDLDTKEALKKEVKEATKHEEVPEWLETRRNAEYAFGYITTCWQILLLVWLALYGLLAYQVLNSAEPGYGLRQAITIANNCNTLMLILCFSAFNRLEKIEKGSKWNLKDKKWLFGIVAIVLLAVLEAVCIKNYVEIGRRLGNNNLKAEDVLWFFRVVSGLTGAIAMALFVGRLQSKFFNPPAKLIAALYAYTAIQPLFVFFDDDSKSMPFITALVIHTALILKCILFLYLFWTFETGRLLFYLVRVRLTNKEVEKEWQDFQTVLEKNS